MAFISKKNSFPKEMLYDLKCAKSCCLNKIKIVNAQVLMQLHEKDSTFMKAMTVPFQILCLFIFSILLLREKS